MLVVLTVGAPAMAQTNDGRFFKETNKWVRGDFLKFYLQAPDPALLFGVPISDEMVDSTGKKVQYFERARFEQENSALGAKVRLANLGWLLIDYQPASTEVPVFSTTCRYFPRTNKRVCFDFLKFYDKFNGTLYFGDPITNLEIRDGGYVQYFENARLEFRAYLPAGQTIKLADLGRTAFQKYVGDTTPRGGAIISSDIDGLINGTHVHAFVLNPLVKAGARQLVFVIVHDRQSFPSKGARVNIVLEYPGGRRELLSNGVANSFGIYQASFSVAALNINDVVRVLVQSEVMGSTFFASTWFRIWY